MANGKQFTKNERITLYVSIIALVFSILSGVYSTYYTIQKDLKDDSEIIDITLINTSHDEKVSYTKLKVGEIGSSLIPMNYNILVSNNSKRTISIINHKLTQTINGKMLFYSNLINNVAIDNKEIDYPITIEPGESVKVIFSINILLKPVVDNLIQEKYSYNSKIPYSELYEHLISNGYDIHGNKINATFFEDNTYLIESEGDYNVPNYRVIFRTAKGNDFSKNINEKDVFDSF